MKRLAEILKRQHLISPEELERAVEEHHRKAVRLRDVLHDNEIVPKEALAAAVATAIGVPYLDPRTTELDPNLTKILTYRLAEKFNCVPVERSGKGFMVLMADPQDLLSLRDLEFALGASVIPRFAFKKEIEEARDRLYNHERWNTPENFSEACDVEFFNAAEAGAAADNDNLYALVHDASSPVIRLVSHLIAAANAKRASDVHIEQCLSHSLVRFRIDGVLRDFMEIPAELRNPVVSRIKILAEMDITDRRAPQDGSFMVRLGKERRDLRVSSLPTQYGEKIVMRMLNPNGAKVTLGELGLDREHERVLMATLNSPQGMLLVTGPTGSGKSTSLYAFLNTLRSANLNISTIENPIEYIIDGANQVQVNAKAGRTFAACIRSLLRQDPNVIMVGEVRDAETAEVALQAAQTGHLVLSTLHTNDAASAVTRLLDLGVPGFMAAASLSAVVAQRLVRRLCECRTSAPATPEVRQFVGAFGLVDDLDQIFLPKGCEKCEFTGYRGRIGIYEVLVVGEAIRKAIRMGESSEVMRAIAMQNGFRPMQQDAVAKIAAGQTSLEEVMRTVPCDTSRAEYPSSSSGGATPVFPSNNVISEISRASQPVFHVTDIGNTHAMYHMSGRAQARGNS